MDIGAADDTSAREREEQRHFLKLLEPRFFFYRHDVDGVFTYLSPSITTVLGYTPDEFQTHYTTYLTDNPLNREVIRHTELSIQGIQQPSYFVEIRHKNGSVRMLLVTEYSVRGPEGRVVAVEGIGQDITEQKRDQEVEFRRHQRELVDLSRRVALHVEILPRVLAEITETASALLDVDRASIWRFSEDGSVLRCLDLYSRGRGAHENGLEWRMADFPVYFRAIEEDRVVNAERARVDPRTREFAEAYLVPLDIHSMLDSPIRVRGRVIGVICHEATGHERRWGSDDQELAASFADLTALAFEMHERARAEKTLEETSHRNRELAEQLLVANERLRELDRLKNEFLAMVSHELRIPMAASGGAMENLLKGVAGELSQRQAELVMMMHRNCGRLGRLIDNLLDLSQIDAGRFFPNRKETDLRAPVKTAVYTSHAGAVEVGVTILYDEPAVPVTAWVDEDRVVQIVLNLLDNAIRFAKREVRLELSFDEEHARIVVDDDGEGIPLEKLSTIFNKFERRGPASDLGGHVGLGLAIVRALVEAHGGTAIALNRAPDAPGTRIVVTLPRGESQE